MKKTSLIELIRLVGTVVIVAIGVLMIALDIGDSYRDFRLRSEQQRVDYIEGQKDTVKLEVTQAVQMIRESRADIEKDAKARVESRAKDAYTIAEHIYRLNRGKKGDAEIQQMIVESLRSSSFFYGAGDYFITRFDGTAVLFADRPQLEGKNILNLTDPDGKNIVRDMIEIASKKGGGFYSYRWTKPGRKGNGFRKIAFIRSFEPYKWCIGTGIYFDYVEDQWEKELLKKVSNIRFGKEGYIFVNRYNGDSLVSNGLVMAGKGRLWDVFSADREASKDLFAKELRAAQTPGGGYINYPFVKLTTKKISTKTSFVYGIPELQWLVGAGFYSDEIEGPIQKTTTALKVELWKRVERGALVIALVTIVFLIVMRILDKKIKYHLNLLLDFFSRAAYSDEMFDRSRLYFEEWDLMADYANKMLLDRRVAREQLLNEKERLSVTLHSIGDAVISTDRSGRVEQMNAVAENLTGWSDVEAQGKSLTDVFAIANSKTGEKAENPVAKVLEQGEVVGITNHTKLISKNGAEYQIADSAAPIRDRDGNVSGVVLVFRDVTERYRKEEELRRSEADLRTILDAAKNVAFIKTDVDNKLGKIVQYSAGAETIFGYTQKEAMGRYVAMLHLPEDVERFPAMLAEMSKNRRIGFNGEITMVRKSGERFPALLTTYPLFNADGFMVQVIGVIIDISKQKEAEEEIRRLDKLRSIGILAGGLAHDFNNILMGLFGNISLAKAKIEAGGSALPYIEKAEQSLERAKGLTNQLLTFAKGGAPAREDISLPDMVEQTVQFDLSGSNVKLVLEIAPDLWKATADRGQISQVFSNLTINARQAMPEGGLLTISMKNSEISPGLLTGLSAGRYLKITVADQGCGIEKQKLDKIFDPYFTTKQHGRGLGLATAYSIISKHGGTIQVESDVGKGTTFTFYLPAAEEGKPLPFVAVEETGPERKTPGKPRILIMDDEEMVREVVREMMEYVGFEVETVADGASALECYRQAMEAGSRFDCVIMDITIPGGMGGKETMRRLLEIDADAKAIVSSGYADDLIMAGYEAYGFKGAITKPFRMEQLKKEVERLLVA